MATTAARSRAGAWSAARVYLVVSGIFLVGAAVAGFGYSTSFPSSAGAVRAAVDPHIYGIFETNGWHNLTALVSGVISLSFALRPEWARTGAFVKGSLYSVVTIAIALWGPETFLIASNAADQVVHATLAASGLAAGFLTPRSR